MNENEEAKGSGVIHILQLQVERGWLLLPLPSLGRK